MSFQRREEEEQEEVEGEQEEVPQSVAELAEARVPNALRGIRACKRCGILKTLDQFIDEGCENCPFLDLVSDPNGADGELLEGTSEYLFFCNFFSRYLSILTTDTTG